MKKGKPSVPIALGNALSRESLPLPLVYYPGREGAFHAFAANREEEPVLCACAEEPVRNLLRLGLDPLDYGLFPTPMAIALLDSFDPAEALTFRPGLCHRCNRVPPLLRYCHEKGGPRFVQTYGWYIKQSYLRLGIHPSGERYLPDICRPEFQAKLNEIRALLEQARAVRATLAARMNEERREIPPSERTHWPNVTKTELAPLEEIEWQLGRPRRALENAVQNILRAEFGVKAVGEAWVSETELYRIVCRLFPGEQVRFHYRPDWLEGLELDVCLPERKLALEYQGQQHFKPIKAWGGEAALQQLQARDARKVERCTQAGFHLIHIHHDEPLTEEHIRERLQDHRHD